VTFKISIEHFCFILCSITKQHTQFILRLSCNSSLEKHHTESPNMIDVHANTVKGGELEPFEYSLTCGWSVQISDHAASAIPAWSSEPDPFQQAFPAPHHPTGKPDQLSRRGMLAAPARRAVAGNLAEPIGKMGLIGKATRERNIGQ
jgi:hypothetical protein